MGSRYRQSDLAWDRPPARGVAPPPLTRKVEVTVTEQHELRFPSTQFVEETAPSVVDAQVYHDSLPIHQQVAYRTSALRSGGWQFVVWHEVRAWSLVEQSLISTAGSYSRLTEQGREMLRSVLDHSQAIRDLGASILSVIPRWAQSAAIAFVSRLMSKPPSQMQDALDVVRDVKQALTIATCVCSATYHEQTSVTLGARAASRIADTTIPPGVSAAAAAGLRKPIYRFFGDDAIGQGILKLIEAAFDELNKRTNKAAEVLFGSVAAEYQQRYGCLTVTQETSKVAIALGIVELIEEVLVDLMQSPRLLASGMAEARKAVLDRAARVQGPKADPLGSTTSR